MGRLTRCATIFAFGFWLTLCLCAYGQSGSSALPASRPAGSDTSQLASTIPPFNLPVSIVAADFNRDDALDLAVAVTFVNGPPPHPGFDAVILQDPLARGKFLPAVHYATGSDPSAIATADLNGDGLPDLVVANGTSGNISSCFRTVSRLAIFCLRKTFTPAAIRTVSRLVI
jgi:FG-GAP repeat protein